MEHLTDETLARLVDDEATTDELGHLESCEGCAGRLGELREQTAALGSLPDLRPPVGDWEVLQARLVSEGLIRSGRRLAHGLAFTPGWMQAVAALILFIGGAAAGGVAVRRPTVANFIGAAPGGAVVAPSNQVVSSEEAAQRVRLAERQYMDALVQYRQLLEARDDGSAPDPTSRFAAIEYLVRASQVALREAPADPFVNGVLASAVAEREAVLRRISTAGDDNWY